MKAFFKYATIALAAVSSFACNKIAGPSVDLSGTEMVFIASRENLASKSFRMDDGSVWWNAAEEVSIFYGSGAADDPSVLIRNKFPDVIDIKF